MIKEHLDWMQRKAYSLRTIQASEEVIGHFNVYLWDTLQKKLNEATDEDLTRYLLYLKEKRSPATVNYTIVQLRRFYRFLKREGMILKDPCADIALIRCQKIPKDVPDEEAVNVFLNAPDEYTYEGIRDKAIVELIYSSGLRNTELRELAVGDIDFQDKTVRILKAKGQKQRVVPLGKKASRCIQHYLEITRPRRWKKAGENILFISRLGGKISKTNLSRIFEKYARMSERTRKITPHVLRHACALHMLRKGAPIAILQELLGHASMDSTQIYTRLYPKDLKRAHRRFHPSERRGR